MYFMEPAPPDDSDSLPVPDLPPEASAPRLSAKVAASLSLLSPFVGLSAALIFKAIEGENGKVDHITSWEEL